MKENEKKQKKEFGEHEYLNKNCWLIKTLNYAPYKRCHYCQLRFRDCLFLHYQIISLILILFIFTLSFLIEGELSKLVVISIFSLVLVYGYFFNKSTDKVIKANFGERKAKNALKELNNKLKERVDEQVMKLKKAYRRLKKIDKTKTEFMSIVSHQLRTPLSIIKGHLSMINEGIYDKNQERKKEVLDNIYESNERLITLVNDVLNVSRIQSGRVEMKKEKADLGEIAKEIMDKMKPHAEEKGIELVFREPEEKLPLLRMDISKIENVLINLFDNAIKYTNEGSVKVSLKREEDFVKMEVRDMGEGMTGEELEKLFETFSRGDAGKKYWIQGVGLGLYIARQFVEMHDGKIWAESEGKEKGSQFYVKLPVNG